MPVKAVGKRIVNAKTGKVEGKASSKKNAAISAWIRNNPEKARKKTK